MLQLPHDYITITATISCTRRTQSYQKRCTAPYRFHLEPTSIGPVNRPFDPPIAPMLSRAADALPEGEGWQFEPKWDGFPTVVFRDGEDLFLQSRNTQPMNRYFPELTAPLQASLPERGVRDGEIVIVGERGLDFEAERSTQKENGPACYTAVGAW
jgi:ATP-dependent DNA ligase